MSIFAKLILNLLNMKKSILLIVALSFAMVLSLVSCKPEAEKQEAKAPEVKSDDVKTEVVEEKDVNYIEALEKACKEGNKDCVIKCAVDANEYMAKSIINELKNVKTAEDFDKASSSIDVLSDELEKVMENCDCVTDEELDEAVESVTSKYEEDLTKAMTEAMERIGK